MDSGLELLECVDAMMKVNKFLLALTSQFYHHLNISDEVDNKFIEESNREKTNEEEIVPTLDVSIRSCSVKEILRKTCVFSVIRNVFFSAVLLFAICTVLVFMSSLIFLCGAIILRRYVLK